MFWRLQNHKNALGGLESSDYPTRKAAAEKYLDQLAPILREADIFIGGQDSKK